MVNAKFLIKRYYLSECLVSGLKKVVLLKVYKVKSILLSFIILCCCISGHAQADTSLLYLRFPTVPPFSITRAPDSVRFTKDNLHKKTATIIMVFSPDCEHCQHEVNEIKAHINLFKKAQIVMASPLDYSYLKKFYEDYKIADYPNITIGRDPTYMLGTFYHVRSFPAIFVYNKKGKFIKAFDGTVPVREIADAL